MSDSLQLGSVPLRKIGFWRSPIEADLPDANDFVDPSWDPTERDLVSQYVANGLAVGYWLGSSPCSFCGKLGSGVDLTDGTYVWPQGLAHYLDEHAVRLPQQFVDHCLAMRKKLAACSSESSWWRAQVKP